MLDKSSPAFRISLDSGLPKARSIIAECPLKARIRMASRSCSLTRYRLDVLPPFVGEPPTTNADRYETQTD